MTENTSEAFPRISELLKNIRSKKISITKVTSNEEDIEKLVQDLQRLDYELHSLLEKLNQHSEPSTH